jgi:cysteine desulfurase
MSYFDNNATTPMHPLALDALTQAYQDDWSNPSSPYRQSNRTKAKLNKARCEWAQLFGSKESDVVFTSGATEANNMVIASAARNHSGRARILISGIEHPSVSIPAKHCFQNRVDVLPMESHGLVCLASLRENFERGLLPVLVCVMAANNESGVVQPWAEVARICEQYEVPFHCDATQWVGKLPISGFHHAFSFTASAHKFGGPKGVGWLVDKGGSSWQEGGTQEGGKRAGTENFPAIASMIKAWHECDRLLQQVKAEDRVPWRNNMEEKVCSHIPGTQVIGQDVQRLWNTSLLLMPKFDNLSWIAKLDALGFEVSTGSACSTGSDLQSSTAQAFSLDPLESKRLVRISSYLSHSQEDWNNLGDAFILAYQQLLEDSQDSNVISI